MPRAARPDSLHVLTGALVAVSVAMCAFSLWAVVDTATRSAAAVEQARKATEVQAQGDVSDTMYDTPIPEGTYMPLMLQEDPQWGYIPYAGGSIADSGCGLTCAAMAIQFMTTQAVTPLSLADAVGDTCLTDGVNDMGKFCDYIAGAYSSYNIQCGGACYTTKAALDAVDDGFMAFGGMSGRIGEKSYGGHVVLIWRADESGYWVRDPDSAANSSRPFSREELLAVDFKYFYTIRGGFYGA